MYTYFKFIQNLVDETWNDIYAFSQNPKDILYQRALWERYRLIALYTIIPVVIITIMLFDWKDGRIFLLSIRNVIDVLLYLLFFFFFSWSLILMAIPIWVGKLFIWIHVPILFVMWGSLFIFVPAVGLSHIFSGF